MENKKLSYLDILYYAKWEIVARIKREKLRKKSHSTYDLKDYKNKLIEIEKLIEEEYFKIVEELNKNKE